MPAQSSRTRAPSATPAVPSLPCRRPLTENGIERVGDLAGVVGPVVVVAPDRVQGGVPGEGPCLAIVAIEGVEGRGDGGMAQSVRPDLEAGLFAELADNVKDARA